MLHNKKGKKTLGRWWVLILLAWLCLGSAQARELVAVGTEFPRIFEVKGQGSYPVGLAVDLLKRAADKLGYRIRFESYPWLRAQSMAAQGQADILIGPYRTREREAVFLFSKQPFYEDSLVFYARRKQTPAPWDGDFSALTRHSVGLLRGWAYGEAFERARSQMRVSVANNIETGLTMLRAGRIELLACNERNTAPVIAALGLGEELVPLHPPIGFLRGHFAYARGTAGSALQREVDRAIAEMREAGELRELGKRWKVAIPE